MYVFILKLVHNLNIIGKDKSRKHPPEISIPNHLRFVSV